MDKLGTVIHGIGASEHLDSSGERISVEGIDISSLEHDGLVNFEHKSDTSSQLIGKVVEATKILKKEDCKNKHHEYFWEKSGKTPYLYIKGVLFDQFNHSGANDAVAMLRFDQAMDNKNTRQVCGFSVEGSRLDKEGSLIKKCIARKISFTAYPCNKACVAEILNQEKAEVKPLISLMDLQLAFKKSEKIEEDMKKAEKKYLVNLSNKPTKESKPTSRWQFSQTLSPSQILKTESNVRKKISKKKVSKNMTSPTIKTKIHMSEKSMAKAKKEILKSMSDEAFELFKNKDLLIDIAKSKMPNASEQEVMAFAKTYAYVQMKKSEMGLEKIANEIEKEEKGVHESFMTNRQSKQPYAEKGYKGISTSGNRARLATRQKAHGLGDNALKEVRQEHKQKLNELKQIKPNLPKSEEACDKEGEDLNKKGRCWDGYEPTPGKKAFSQGSCKPVKKAEVPSNEIHLYKYEDGTAEIVWGEAVLDKTVDTIIKSELDGWQESHEDIEKKEKPFLNYNSKKHSKEGGLNDKAREKYNRENGSNLKRPVTGKVKAGSKSAKRRKSFCARMSGVKGPTSKEGKLTPKGASLKRWKC